MLNMYKMLDIYDLKDLAHAYTRAYLSLAKSTQRPRRDFGAFEESRLIRTEDNSIFTILTCPDIPNRVEAIQRQSIGSNIQEYFVHIIAHFIVNGYRTLPSDKLKIAFCINHNNAHWTMMQATFNQINVKAYERLFQKCQPILRAEPVDLNHTTDQKTHQMNRVRNFILRQQGVRLHTRTRKRNILTTNGRLPLKVQSIDLKHYDSMDTDYSDLLRESTRLLAQSNKLRISHEKCTRQSGMTCGDWSVFNAFNYGVLKNKMNPTSKNLRDLKNNLTVKNANQILKQKHPHIQSCPENERLCVTRRERAIMENAYNDADPGFVQNLLTFAYSAYNSASSALSHFNPFARTEQPAKRTSQRL